MMWPETKLTYSKQVVLAGNHSQACIVRCVRAQLTPHLRSLDDGRAR